MKLQLSIAALAVAMLAAPAATRAQDLSRLAPAVLPQAERPFGTLQEQAAMQHEWLKKRLDTFLPALRTAGVAEVDIDAITAVNPALAFGL